MALLSRRTAPVTSPVSAYLGAVFALSGRYERRSSRTRRSPANARWRCKASSSASARRSRSVRRSPTSARSSATVAAGASARRCASSCEPHTTTTSPVASRVFVRTRESRAPHTTQCFSSVMPESWPRPPLGAKIPAQLGHARARNRRSDPRTSGAWWFWAGTRDERGLSRRAPVSRRAPSAPPAGPRSRSSPTDRRPCRPSRRAPR